MVRDPTPSVPRTAKRMLATIKKLFFQEKNENVKNACALSFKEIFDNCLRGYETIGGKPPRDIIYDPLLEELRGGKSTVARQSASYVLRRLNEWYVKDSRVVDGLLCQTISAVGIQFKVYDCDFLMALVDLINHRGLFETLGVNISKASEYALNSLRFNYTGQNAVGKVQKDQNISASIVFLAVLANGLTGLDTTKEIASAHHTLVLTALNQVKGDTL